VVRAGLCVPAGGGPGPAAIVLHGCGGFNTFDHRLAVDLPRDGIATLYLDYFGPTPPPGKRGFCNEHAAVGTSFPIWEREVLDAAALLRREPRVDPRQIAVVGWSLGGGLAVATVADHPGAFQAVVGFSTGAFVPVSGVSRLPPTLLLSGGPRDAIPLAATEELYRGLRAAGVKATLFDYGDGTHNWPGKQGSAGIAAAERFLHRSLPP
jgi:dienelactone hydrolase